MTVDRADGREDIPGRHGTERERPSERDAWEWLLPRSGRGRMLFAVRVGALLLVGGVCGFVAHRTWKALSDSLATELVVGIVGAVTITAATAVLSWILKPGNGHGPRFPPWNVLLPRLAAVVVVLAAATVTFVAAEANPGPDSCGRTPSEDAVEVMVVWTNDDSEELEDFCTVVAAYPFGDEVGDVAVHSVGVEIGRELTDAIDDGDRPDVAIVPQPSLVKRLEDELVPLTHRIEALEHAGEEAQGIPQRWSSLVSVEDEPGEDVVLGAFVKGAHKSLFWYSPDVVQDFSPEVAGYMSEAGNTDAEGWTWEEFQGFFDQVAEHRGEQAQHAALTLAAADDWPLTDWFENQLAALNPDLYRRLSDGDNSISWNVNSDEYQVLAEALGRMYDLFGDPTVYPVGESLPTQTNLAELDDRLTGREALLVFAPSFLAGRVEASGPDDAQTFRFPDLRWQNLAVVGGDIAVVPRQDGSRKGVQFVDWLTSDEAIERWSETDGGYMAPNWESPDAPEPGERERCEGPPRELLTCQLVEYGMPDNDYTLLFDLSDDQFATREEGDPIATWGTFARFFQEITGRTVPRDDAIRNVIEDLCEVYTRSGPDCP